MSATKLKKPEDDGTLDLFAAGGQGGGSGGTGAPPGSGGAGRDGDFIDMGTFAERSYLTYAMSVVRGKVYARQAASTALSMHRARRAAAWRCLFTLRREVMG